MEIRCVCRVPVCGHKLQGGNRPSPLDPFETMQRAAAAFGPSEALNCDDGATKA